MWAMLEKINRSFSLPSPPTIHPSASSNKLKHFRRFGSTKFYPFPSSIPYPHVVNLNALAQEHQRVWQKQASAIAAHTQNTRLQNPPPQPLRKVLQRLWAPTYL